MWNSIPRPLKKSIGAKPNLKWYLVFYFDYASLVGIGYSPNINTQSIL
jgi:hypothetical protein